MQMGSGQLYVVVLALTGSRFRREHSTAVDLLEISVRELVVSLRLLLLPVVDPQIPPGVGIPPVLLDVLVLLLGCGFMLAPRVPVVDDELSVLDQRLGVIEGRTVELHGHGVDPPPDRRATACTELQESASRDRVVFAQGLTSGNLRKKAVWGTENVRNFERRLPNFGGEVSVRAASGRGRSGTPTAVTPAPVRAPSSSAARNRTAWPRAG